MSQLRRCAVKIKTANEQLVKATMEAIAKTLGGQLVTQVQDFSGRWAKVMSGVMVPGVDGIRGFGVTVSGGNIVVIGDDYQQQMRIEEFTKMFQNFYVATATTSALKNMGYKANANFQDGRIYVRGVKGLVGVI